MMLTAAKMTADSVLASIRAAFGPNEYPGDPFLQGSYEGIEPGEETGAFRDRCEWQTLDSSFLDAHASALSFFSEAGFRFFLPAYLVADVQGSLTTADPLFHLTNGFSDSSMVDRRGGRDFVRRWGGSTFINPRRYGAATAYDHWRFRLSVFTREEAAAIVGYLEWRRDAPSSIDNDRRIIDAALERFWRERAASAPTAAMLSEHLRSEQEYFAQLR
jgi:hypothetical protein